jgi:hypothetical protein
MVEVSPFHFSSLVYAGQPFNFPNVDISGADQDRPARLLIHLAESQCQALSNMDQRQYQNNHVTRIPLSITELKLTARCSTPNSKSKAHEQTFEMDYIDAEFVSPIDEVVQEQNKE